VPSACLQYECYLAHGLNAEQPVGRPHYCSRVKTVTYEEQWLNMAVGALRAAGIAAAALGYHVWRLLTKQDAAALADIEDSEEVVHKTKRLLLLP